MKTKQQQSLFFVCVSLAAIVISVVYLCREILVAGPKGPDGDAGQAGTNGDQGIEGFYGPKVLISYTVPYETLVTLTNLFQIDHFSPASNFTIPANSMSIGNVLRLEMVGVMFTSDSSGGIELNFSIPTATIIFATIPNFATLADFEFKCDVTFLSLSTANVVCEYYVKTSSETTYHSGFNSNILFDTTQDQLLQLTLNINYDDTPGTNISMIRVTKM